MKNIPEVKVGIIAVSRDCFPIALSINRRKQLVKECEKINLKVSDIETVIENENDVLKGLTEIRKKNVNSLVIYLGNFGPEGPLTLLAQKFEGPVMVVGAAEESGNNLINGRGDALCGMLNASYNIGLRNLRIYIPEYPIGTANEIALMISDFIPLSRVLLGLKKLKIFSFGPRPHDFLACNAPIKPLYDIGVELMENSELDLFELYKSAEGNPGIKDIIIDMENELGKGNNHPGVLEKLARYELVLSDFMEKNLGASEFGVFANKCWPAFQSAFGFVPCYVNSRFASRGIPIACETDIYGALSEYMITAATNAPATLLDINNSVPYDMIKEAGNKTGRYSSKDLFMGFHCGNTCSSCMSNPSMKHQLIMHRLLEPDKEPDITRGTLEGNIMPGNITIFRFQATAEGKLKSYIAEGEILDIDPKSFGSIAVFAINEMGRFYRNVLIEEKFPHHTGVAFSHAGKTLFNVAKMLGLNDIFYNLPKGVNYKNENPFG
ncbi:L-fucose/L-arabinose isomerase family protein [Bacteroidota bacterium]